MKWLIAAAALLLAPAMSFADDGRYQTEGRVSTGVEQFDNDTGSSKLEEYRDLDDGAYVPRLRLDVMDTQTGRFFDLSATRLPRNDADVLIRAGGPGTWGLDVEWTGIPHLLSNKARTPFTDAGSGRFVSASVIPITFKKLATAAGDTAGVLASDDLIAAFAATATGPTDLGTQRDRATIELRYNAIEAIKLRLGYSVQDKDGSQVGYGPIGDRPPRTLNIQLAEPVDHRTQDVRFQAEYSGRRYQAQVGYELSDFANAIDTFTWQNIYATPAAGADFDAWDRSVSAFGRRPLSPDNRYHHLTSTFGFDLPRDSRLTVSGAYGRMEQDQSLLPYSFSTAIANPTLPRDSAEGRIDTLNVTADYTIGFGDRVDVRARYRYYDLDNQTPQSQWQYVTSDTANLNGTVSFKNKRVNLAYAYDRQDASLDATWRLGFWGSRLGVGLEREAVDRRFREANTDENRVRATLRSRPATWLSLRAGYLFADRDGGEYDNNVTRQSYWYAPAEAGTDADSPLVAFSNHPDMRRFDVSDRRRHQVDGMATVTRSAVSASASVRYRDDDFESGVVPTQPLLGTGVADAAAFTPGDQLGLLADERLRYSVDLVYAPDKRWSANAFGSWESADKSQRGLEFNENNKLNPSTVATAELGPWTRAASEWTTDLDEDTHTFGVGATYAIVAEKVTLGASYTLSRSTLGIGYGGFGVTSSLSDALLPDNHQFAFRPPPDIRHDTDVFNLTLDYRVRDSLVIGAGYIYDRFEIADWQQETESPWFESLGSEFLLRDSSRSFQWGNRLFNLGSYLAPSYDAHVGYLTLSYRF